jgi:hypothetical protein
MASHTRPQASARWNEQNNQQQYSVAAGICKTRIQKLLKYPANSPGASTYWVYVQYVGAYAGAYVDPYVYPDGLTPPRETG